MHFEMYFTIQIQPQANKIRSLLRTGKHSVCELFNLNLFIQLDLFNWKIWKSVFFIYLLNCFQRSKQLPTTRTTAKQITFIASIMPKSLSTESPIARWKIPFIGVRCGHLSCSDMHENIWDYMREVGGLMFFIWYWFTSDWVQINNK